MCVWHFAGVTSHIAARATILPSACCVSAAHGVTSCCYYGVTYLLTQFRSQQLNGQKGGGGGEGSAAPIGETLRYEGGRGLAYYVFAHIEWMGPSRPSRMHLDGIVCNIVLDVRVFGHLIRCVLSMIMSNQEQ